MALNSVLLRTVTVTALVGMIVATASCGPAGLVLGAGAGAGIAAYQERGIDGVARDVSLSSRILGEYARADHHLLTSIGVEVYESRAMLTGQVKTEEDRANAVRLAWSVAGVEDVINEIHVTEGGGALDTARDTWITAQLEGKLTFDERILAINYVIETVGGTVYLLGIAQNDAELQRVINHIRSIDYVQRIVSHVRVKEQLPSQTPNGS